MPLVVWKVPPNPILEKLNILDKIIFINASLFWNMDSTIQPLIKLPFYNWVVGDREFIALRILVRISENSGHTNAFLEAANILDSTRVKQ